MNVSARNRVVVFGSANQDQILAVDDFPAPGETIIAASSLRGLGGKGANQAVAAARGGAHTLFVGEVGDDEAGDELVANLRENGIDTVWLQRSATEPTGSAVILVNAAGENKIVVSPGANSTLSSTTLDSALSTVTRDDVVVVQCEIPAAQVEHVVRDAARTGARAILNLAPYTRIDPAVFASVDLLVVNESEARSLVGSPPDLAAAVVAVASCACVLTLGERGSIFATPDAAMTFVDAVLVEDVVDTTGAGDTYVGALAAAVARGERIPTAMAAASRAAALSVATLGAQPSSAAAPLHLTASKG